MSRSVEALTWRKRIIQADGPLANGKTRIDFQTEPARYRHWKLNVDGDIATLVMDVDEKAGAVRRL